ncbi:UNVERIFIED_ORG: V/A-type H+-transporting ATPase subunit B [Microbispora rosea subsp. rosea]
MTEAVASGATGTGATFWAPVEYTDVAELRGPLIVVRGIGHRGRGVGWDEYASIELESGEVRHGLVLESDRDLAVIQVFEGTAGIRAEGTRVRFAGRPMRVPVGAGWLGRVCDGRGRPLDGGPPVSGASDAAVNGFPLNPTLREPPAEPVLTGISAIDLLTTLVRGQKIAVFSGGGLPHLELAAQIAAQAGSATGSASGSGGGTPFSVVFAAMGLTHADAAAVRDTLEERSAGGGLTLLLNLADDPVIERMLTPRLALTVAEHLAFTLGRHVLVVLADMTAYCEALREVSAARGEIPARRAYPGYLYSDLASLYERCGRVRGRDGSLTVLPVLSMPAGDITHPVPDLTGYITEGQILLTRDVSSYPHIDPLSSLSRMMRAGAGPGRTRPEHVDLAAQILAALSRARQARELAEMAGESALSPVDRRYLALAGAFERDLLAQRRDEFRSLEETFDRAWRVVSVLPRRELSMLPGDVLDANYREGT